MSKDGKEIGLGRKYDAEMWKCDEEIASLMVTWMEKLGPSKIAALLLRHAAIVAMTDGMTSSVIFGKVAANSFLTEVKREAEGTSDDGKPRN